MEDKAKLAIERAEKVNYTTSTEGWGLIEAELEKEIKWAFDKSVSAAFREDVLKNPQVYFEHFGYVNGLKQVKDIIIKINNAAEKANKDIKLWESQKNRHTSKASQIQSLGR